MKTEERKKMKQFMNKSEDRAIIERFYKSFVRSKNGFDVVQAYPVEEFEYFILSEVKRARINEVKKVIGILKMYDVEAPELNEYLKFLKSFLKLKEEERDI